MASKLHKTAKGRHELAVGIRTLSQRERTVLVLSDGHKSVQDFHRELGPVAAKVAQDLVAGGYLEEKADTFAATVPASLPLVASLAVCKDSTVPTPLTVPMSLAAAQLPTRPAPLLGEAHVQSTAHILVVDDSEVALRSMQHQLRGFKATVHFAYSGDAALSLLPKYDFQIVFLDVMMAGLDGYQTCRAIKNFKTRSGHMPAVVMLTSRGGVIDKIRGAMARCDAYLTKPIHKGDLLAAMLQFAPAAVDGTPSLAQAH